MRAPTRWMPSLLAVLLPVLIMAGPAGRSDAASPQPAPAPLATPLLSVRRDPAWVDQTLARQRLDTALSRVTAGRFGAAKEPAGCLVVSQDGAALYQLDPGQELMPASNMKII